MNGKWLEQKLAQNGFSAADLAAQTGLDLSQIESVINNQSADQNVWDIILSTLNQYPAVRYPAASILEDLQSDIETYGKDARCLVFYGVNQNSMAFCEYQPLENLQLHGANVDTSYLSVLNLSLQEALDLFTKQNYSIQTYSNHQNG